MASWRDNLQPASFRSVPFFYLDTEGEGGRRTVEHEFPFRDTSYTEDLGKKNRTYRLQAFVIGDDYFTQRDALLTALETQGSGTLVHPYLGSLTVNVKTPFKWRETMKDGRMASFDLVFVDAGNNPSPTAAADTAAQSLSAVDDSNAQLQTSFDDAYTTTDLPIAVADAASDLVLSIQSMMTGLMAGAGIADAALADLVASLSSLVSQPASLAAAVTQFFSGYVSDVVGSWTPFDESLSSRGPTPVGDPSYGLASAVSWGSTLAAPPSLTPAQVQMGVNQGALVALVQGAATVAMVQLYANTSFASEEDAETARDQVTDLIDALSVSAADSGDDAGYAQYLALFQSVTTDLTTRGKQLPDVVTVDFGAPLPALYIAQRLYQDASRAGELIARNAAPHPLFFPLDVEALSS